METQEFALVTGPSPFTASIDNLIKGKPYFVRVRARNSQGLGAFLASTPASEYPRELPTAPLGVRLGVTSGRSGDGKLTVTWAMPTCDGGDNVTSFRIKWDLNAEFNSLNLPPHKNEVDVLVTNSFSYTISNLNVGVMYFVSVAAQNRVGLRYIPTPLSAVPSLRKSRCLLVGISVSVCRCVGVSVCRCVGGCH
jgi:hypothetical protein